MTPRIALVLLALTFAPAAVAQVITEEPPCALTAPGWEGVTSAACLGCHAAAAGAAPALQRTHAVDVRYETARAGDGSRYLRAIEEVERAGALLPQGEVRCVSCHHGGSPWRYRLALPAGAADDEPTPLCTVCHRVGD